MAAMGILINMSQYAEKGRVKSGKWHRRCHPRMSLSGICRL